MRRIRRPLAIAALLALAACSTGGGSGAVDLPAPTGAATLVLSTEAFADGAPIPARYTCDGQGLAPLLTWQAPGSPAEFVVVMTDPDAPGGTFVHWVMFGISPETPSVGEGQGPAGARQGTNSFGSVGYGAPCPTPGDSPHHYVFTMYALSTQSTRGLPSGATLEQVVKRISCCIAASGTLSGTYER
jgi:Raf kinase inhibitor-like YbhB/YbcL family protein